MIEGRIDVLNDLLEPLGLSCSPRTYARLVGPLQFTALIARQPITDELIDEIARDLAPQLDRR